MDNQNYDIDEEKEKLKNKNAAAMLHGAEMNSKMAKEQETLDSLKAEIEKRANAFIGPEETKETKETKKTKESTKPSSGYKYERLVPGRRDPAQARPSKFIKVDWKPNEISNKAENLSANKDFKDNFIRTADELLGAGRFLWTGSE